MHNVPGAETPYPLEGYGMPESEDKLLQFDYVLESLAAAYDYWVGTIHPDGRPHVRAVWGVMVDGLLHVGGGPHTRWSRNLNENPNVSVNLSDATSGVIIEGTATYITDDKKLIAKTDAAYLEKYNIPHGPVWQITPRKIFAWRDGIKTLTRWRFD